MSCMMSLIVQIRLAHLGNIKKITEVCIGLGNSKEQSERFHQDIYFERRYQGHHNENMLGDYNLELIRGSDLH